eukprot:TRINITY_DN121753_c0_g1_i1.p1 TRINITY_DN121753_c0_g1~~TRINITY_DN121753_c0_g1_i1.p1  ORF type:complete len:403 (-),score=92.56 TRINITY_DN121753_c0_g1_i1:105-1313(-)
MELDTSGVQKANLRTCGRTTTEKDWKPPRLNMRRTASVPTIPSRYETTVHKGYREVLGFGSHALRWQDPIGAQLPGPGQYGQAKSFHEEFMEKPSWGIRGTGGMASRTVRVGPRARPVQPQAGRGVPGPGKYQEMTALAAVKDGKDHNKAEASASFAKPVEHFVAHPQPPSLGNPGPGQYTQQLAKAHLKDLAAAAAAFRSKSSRMSNARDPREAYPGPGEYFDGAKCCFPADAPTAPADHPAFKAPHKPKFVPLHKDLPTVDEAGRHALGEFAKQVGKECLGTVGLSESMPGPGAYVVNRDKIWEGKTVGVMGNSGFVEGTMRTDFSGTVETRQKPGPGKYNPSYSVVDADRLNSGVAAFASESDRGRLRAPDAPGPCYYSPDMPKATRSFRLHNPDMFVA